MFAWIDQERDQSCNHMAFSLCKLSIYWSQNYFDILQKCLLTFNVWYLTPDLKCSPLVWPSNTNDHRLDHDWITFFLLKLWTHWTGPTHVMKTCVHSFDGQQCVFVDTFKECWIHIDYFEGNFRIKPCLLELKHYCSISVYSNPLNCLLLYP